MPMSTYNNKNVPVQCMPVSNVKYTLFDISNKTVGVEFIVLSPVQIPPSFTISNHKFPASLNVEAVSKVIKASSRVYPLLDTVT